MSKVEGPTTCIKCDKEFQAEGAKSMRADGSCGFHTHYCWCSDCVPETLEEAGKDIQEAYGKGMKHTDDSYERNLSKERKKK